MVLVKQELIQWPSAHGFSTYGFWASASFNSLYSGNPLTSTYANSEYPDKMQDYIRVFTVSKGRNEFQTNVYIFLKNYNLTPIDTYDGLDLSQVYCFKPEGIIH